MDESGLSRAKHDLANPLSAILAETQLLLLRAEELPPDMLESLEAIEAAALRMRAMIKELA
jgi:signal transduction histidine kinase